MSFVIFDTEYTSWKGCLQNGWLGNQKKEIVQIAAIKVSDDLTKVEAEFNRYCKPIINPVLSEYFEDLSGITNRFLSENGILFEQAYNEFTKFVGNDKCWSHSYGAPIDDLSDGHIFMENMKLYKIQSEKKLNYGNIAAWLINCYKEANIENYPKSSGQIAKVLKHEDELASLGLDEHNALYDVYSILSGLRHFRDKFLKDFKK